jgi:hypothetical protein
MVAQVLEIWEKEINGGGLPAEEQGERRRSRAISGLSVGKKSALLLHLRLP